MTTGEPYTVTTGRDDNRDGRAIDRPAGVSHNSRQGFGTALLSVRLSREFKLKKKGEDGPAIEVGVDAFNVTNHTNFSSVVENYLPPPRPPPL